MSIPVIKVPGIGPKTAELLSQNNIDSVSALVAAGIDKLTAIPGINEIKARAFIEAAKLLQSESPGEVIADSMEKGEPVTILSQTELLSDKKEKKHKKDKKNKKDKKDKKSKHKKPKDKKPKDKKDDNEKRNKKDKDKKSKDKKIKDKKTGRKK